MFQASLRKATSLVASAAIRSQRTSAAMMSTAMNYETLQIKSPEPFVYHVELNRPEKLNAMSTKMWYEVGQCFEALNNDPDCRVIVLSAAGKMFTAGIDLNSMMDLAPRLAEVDDVARKAKILTKLIKSYQESLTWIEKCSKPVIASVHSACIGAGVDMITAADIRYCTKDAWFQVKEADIGMAADVGTLQRLPKVIGSDSLARELCYTARKMQSDEALSCGLVSRVFNDKESLLKGAMEIAKDIASKSPVAIQTTKLNLVYSRDHSVQEGLDHIAHSNQFLLQSEDFTNAVIGAAMKEKNITFSKL